MTKQHQQFINNYKNSNIRRLHECYKNPSIFKLKAEKNILDEMYNLGGYCFRITTHSCNFFSCAYMYDKIDNETGEVITTLVYHTPTKRQEINLLG